MENITTLALAVVVSVSFSTIVAVVITEPLRTILRQLCLEGNASAFWVSFTNVMLYITPLLFAVQFANVHNPSLVETLQTALSSSLFGGFAALLVVGYQISRARPAR
jgi:large-conductance mechanosensitive channel